MSENIAFAAELQRLIDLRDGQRAVHLLVRSDPATRFSRMFNAEMDGVDAGYIERAYLRPQIVLACRVNCGQVRNTHDLFGLMAGTLRLTGLHYRVLSYRDANPRVRRRQADDSAAGAGGTLPVFVRGLHDLDLFPSRTECPTAAAEQGDQFRTLMRTARVLGRLRVRVFRAVMGYIFERGSDYGAYRAAARRAVVDGGGRMVGLRSVHAAVGTEPKSKAVERQVRKLYEEVVEYLRVQWPRSGS